MSRQRRVPDDDPSGTVVSGDALTGDGIPGPIVPGDAEASEATAAAVARLAEPDLPAAERRRALGEIASALRKRGFKDVFRPKAAMGWIAEKHLRPKL